MNNSTFSTINDPFNWKEYISLVATLVVSLVIGVYYWYVQKNANPEKHLVRETMSFVPLTASIVAAAISGVTFLGLPTESYTHGISFSVYLCMCHVLSALISVYICLPIVYNLQMGNLYEYFDKRFDHRVRKLTVIIFVLGQMAFAAISSYPPAVVVNQFSGVSVTYTTIGMLAFCTWYTLIGGFKGVVIIDMIQSAIMIFTVIVLLLFGFWRAGGFMNVWNIAVESGRMSDFTLDPDPTVRLSLWSGVIGNAIAGVTLVSMNQSMYQRYVSLKSLRQAKWACIVAASSISFFSLVMGTIGLQAYATYYGCDPKAGNMVKTYPNVIVHWINDVGLHVNGLRGVFTAGIICASMSTISTGINSVAGVLFLEFIRNNKIGCGLSEGLPTKWVTRLLVVSVGGGCAVFIYAFKDGGSLVELLTCFSAGAGGLVIGLFALGIFAIRANATGSFWGGLISLAIISTIAIGSRIYVIYGLIPSPPVKMMRTDLCPNATLNIPENWSAVNNTAHYILPLFKISIFYYAPLAAGLTFVTGLIISYLTTSDNDEKTKRPELFFKPLRKYLKVSDSIDEVEYEGTHHSLPHANRPRDRLGYRLVKPSDT